MSSNFDIWKIKFHQTEITALMSFLKRSLSEKNRLFLATPNPEILLASLKDLELRKILQSTYNIPDGAGIIWAKDFLAKKSRFPYISGFLSLIGFVFKRKNTITGVDLTRELCVNPEFNSYTKFFLGAGEGIAKKAQHKLLERNPEANFVGHSATHPHDQQIFKTIKACAPDMLFVAYGCPKQEKWLAENLPKLPSVKLAVGVGGTFDFLSEEIKRAPFCMRKTGLEWLYRLIKQPSRWRRIYNATIVFPYKIIKSSFTNKHLDKFVD